MKETLLKRVAKTLKSWGSSPEQLTLRPPVQDQTRDLALPEKTVESKPELVPGNFLTFEFFIELKVGDVVHLAYPKVALRDMISKQVRWGSKAEWSWPDPSKLRIPWIDDGQRGLMGRTLASPEDALGAEGTVGGKILRFEQILDLGHNQIVYALFCPAENFRMAYGFDRLIVEPTYVKPSVPRNAAPDTDS